MNVFINDIPVNRIGNNCIDMSVKFLGISIDEHLTWKNHIQQVNCKISKNNRPRNFRRIPENYRNFSAEFPIPHTFPHISTHFQSGISGKTSLYGNVRKKTVCKCAELYGTLRNFAELYGNVRKSDLVEIWFELASQPDLNCSENVKKLL